MNEKTLQEKIKMCLPQKKADMGLTHDEIYEQDGYNLCVSDVHSSLPKVIEVIREEIEKMDEQEWDISKGEIQEQYVLGNKVGWKLYKKFINDLLK